MSTRGRKKHNSFFYFMKEKKVEVEQRLGRSVDHCELAQHVSPQWQAMSQAQKTKYQEMATGQQHEREKLDCYGVPLRAREEMAQRKVKEKEDMISHIEHLVGMYQCYFGVGRLCFYIISTSVYTYTSEGILVPAELSVIRCNFLEGIIRELHTFFKADIPPGYLNEAFEHSESTHNLLPKQDGPVRQERDRLALTPTEVLSLLQEFLSQDSHQHLIVYTLSSETEQTKKMLLQLIGCEQLQLSDRNLKIYSLEMLFQSMYSYVIGRVTLYEATSMITQCWYDYHPGIACKVHSLNDGGSMMHCTLARVRRWMYLMCQHMKVSENFGVTPVKGKHCPLEDATNGVVMNLPDRMVVTEEAVLWEGGLGAANLLQQQGERDENLCHLLQNRGRSKAERRASFPCLKPGRNTVTRQKRLDSPTDPFLRHCT